MTNVASKGGLRAAHAARTAKHAQRNVQTGPRPAVAVAAAINAAAQSAPDSEAAMAAALAGTAYGRMTVVELRARAKALGLKSASRLNKGDILIAILAHERGQAEAAERAPAQAAATGIPTDPAERAAYYEDLNAEQDLIPQDEDSPGGVYTPEAEEYVTAVNPKGAAKARKLADAIFGHGWVTEVSGDSAKATAVARRGGETLTVVWLGGVYQYDESAHLVHDRTTRLRNVSAAIKLAARSQAAVEAEYGRVISNKRFRPAHTKAAEGHVEGESEGYAVPADKRLFPDAHAATYDELWAALAGYRVVWVNRVSNMTESATVSQNARFFNVRNNPAGEPMVEFCTVGTGFRACRVADIVSTSRKAGKARRTKTLPGGEEVRAA